MLKVSKLKMPDINYFSSGPNRVSPIHGNLSTGRNESKPSSLPSLVKQQRDYMNSFNIRMAKASGPLTVHKDLRQARLENLTNRTKGLAKKFELRKDIPQTTSKSDEFRIKPVETA